MTKNNELWMAARQVVAGSKLALLATADATGWPHCTWMNVEVDAYLEEIFAITAPTSQKAANVRANPRAEWMFATAPMETVVYLSGPTRVVEGEEVKAYWDAIPGKAHAFYRQYCDSDDFRKFAVILTKIEKIVYCRTPGYRKTVVAGMPAASGFREAAPKLSDSSPA